MIFDYLMKINQKKLITKYRLEPFEIRVQTLERTLIDKVFAVKSNRIIDNYGGYLYNNFCKICNPKKNKYIFKNNLFL